MSETTRKISIFVDGKQVENTSKNIRDEFTKLSHQLKYMEYDTQKYIETAKRIDELKTYYNEQQQKLKDIAKAWGQVSEAQKEANKNNPSRQQSVPTTSDSVKNTTSSLSWGKGEDRNYWLKEKDSIEVVEQEIDKLTEKIKTLKINSEEYNQVANKLAQLNEKQTAHKNSIKTMLPEPGSINAVKQEIDKLTEKITKLKYKSDDYNKTASRIQELKTLYAEHQQNLAAIESTWNKIKDSFKANTLAQLTSDIIENISQKVTSFIPDSLNAFGTYEEGLNNLSAITKKEGAELKQLGDDAKTLSTSTIEGNIRIKQSATEIVDAFSLMGSERPELLASTEELERVTKDAIILAEADKSALEGNAEALANVMAQYNMAADQSRRVINVLAAGAQEGAKPISYIKDAINKFGTQADLMNISLEQSVGVIEAIGAKFPQAEVLGTGFLRLLQDMREKGIGMRNGAFDLTTALADVRGELAKGKLMSQIFNKEQALVAENLLQSEQEIYKYQKAVTGTNTALDMAAKNTAGYNASMAQVRNQVEVMAINLGEKLAPVIQKLLPYIGSLTTKLITFTNYIASNIQTIILFAKWLGIGAVSWITYTNAVKVATAVQKFFFASMVDGKVVASGLRQLINKLQDGYIALTARVNGASAATRIFNVVSKANVIGALVAVITAAAAAWYAFRDGATEVIKKSSDMDRIQKRVTESVEEEMGALQSAFQVVKLTKEGTDSRKKAIEELNEKYGKYLPNLLTEKSSLDEINKAQEEAIRLLTNEIKLKIYKDELTQKLTKQEKLRKESEQSKKIETSFKNDKRFQDAYNPYADAQKKIVNSAKDDIKTVEDEIRAINDEISKLMAPTEVPTKTPKPTNTPYIDPDKAKKDGKEAEEALKESFGKYQSALEKLKDKVQDFGFEASRVGQTELQKLLEPLEKEYLDANILPDAIIAAIIAKGKKATKEELEIKQKLIEEKYKLDEYYLERHAGIVKDYADAEMDKFQKASEEKKKTTQEFTEKYNDIISTGSKKELSEFEKNKQEKLKALRELLKELKEKGMEGSELWNKISSSITSTEGEKEKTVIFGMTEDKLEKFKEKFKKIIDAINQVKDLWNQFSELRKQQQENELARDEEANNKKKDNLKKRLDKGLISQATYDKKIAKMDKEMDEKKKAMQHEEAVRSKRGKLFEIAINTASAIVEAAPKVPLMIMAGAVGALQLGIVAATPLPYAKGGFIKGKTFAMMGEAGTEWVASNKLLTNSQTAPVIAGLQAIQEGKSISMPNYQAMQQATAQARTGNVVNNYVTNTTTTQTQENNDQLLKKLDNVLNVLSDPEARRTYISIDDLTRAQDSYNSIKKLARIK